MGNLNGIHLQEDEQSRELGQESWVKMGGPPPYLDAEGVQYVVPTWRSKSTMGLTIRELEYGGMHPAGDEWRPHQSPPGPTILYMDPAQYFLTEIGFGLTGCSQINFNVFSGGLVPIAD